MSVSSSAARRSMLAQLPGAQPFSESEGDQAASDARARDLDRMYERVLRARIAQDDATHVEREGLRAEVETGSALASLVVVALAAALIYALLDRRRLVLAAQRRKS